MGFLGDLGVSRVPSGRGSSGEALFFWAVGQFVGVDEVDPQDRDILFVNLHSNKDGAVRCGRSFFIDHVGSIVN